MDNVHKASKECFVQAQCIDLRCTVRCVVDKYEFDPKPADAWFGLGCVGGGTAERTPKRGVECANEALCLKSDEPDAKHVRLLLRGSPGKKCLGAGPEHRTDGLITLDGHLLAN